jgi:ribonuclease VapC
VTAARAILDASAVLALFRNEPGADAVERLLDGSAMSAVNLSEVIQKTAQHQVPTDGLEFDLESLGVEIVPFGVLHARAAADIWEAWPKAGLSLGDRACLALTQALGGEAITADRSWAKLKGRIAIRTLR